MSLFHTHLLSHLSVRKVLLCMVSKCRGYRHVPHSSLILLTKQKGSAKGGSHICAFHLMRSSEGGTHMRV